MYVNPNIWVGRKKDSGEPYRGLLVYDKVWYGVDGYKIVRAYIIPIEENIFIPQGEKLVVKKWIEVDPASINQEEGL